MNDSKFYTKLTKEIVIFAILILLVVSVKVNNVLTAQNADHIVYLDQQELLDRKRIYNLEQENESLKQLIIETSGIPNEKRKAIFKLKIQQDSVLMDLLKSDINTNKEILRLLETDWEFNNDTEFESLKTK